MRNQELFWSGCILCIISALALVFVAVREYNRDVDINKLTSSGQSERVSAQADHDAIVAVGWRCADEANKSTHLIKVPDYLLTMAADTGPKTSDPPAMLLEPPNYILAAIFLSHQIAWARIVLAEQLRWSSTEMQLFQWTMVVIGAITTVLISMKTMSKEQSRFYTAFGVAAIIFSTLGTTVATMNSFYAPRVVHDHDERSLQALQTLHLQLATGITREDDVCARPANWLSDWRFRRIKAITQQYVALVSSTEAPATLEDESAKSPDGAPTAPVLPAAPNPRDRAADNSR